MNNERGENLILHGLATARGLALGPVFVYRALGEVPVPEYVVSPDRVAGERLRLRQAIDQARRDLEGLVATLRARSGRAEIKVFECHLMLLEDEVLVAEMKKRLEGDRLNAEAAVRRVANFAREMFARMNDAYFRERVRDIDDLERRVLENLLGRAASPQAELKVPSVVVANDLTPSETVQLPRELVLGFAMDGGSTTSHVALLARSMGIPAVTGLGDVTTRVTPGETILLNGTTGEVTLAPDETTRTDFQALLERERAEVAAVTRGGSTGVLKDGSSVSLEVNLHAGAPLEGIRGLAQGVGLYRSEYLWLNGEGEPSEEEQFLAYRAVTEFATALSPTGAATIRCLDIGGDKLVRGISQRSDTRKTEANPFLGNRSIRYLLTNPAVFRTQLRAILRASAFGRVKILYPMISCVEELAAAAKLLDEVRAELTREGVAFDPKIPVGAMIEVPAAAINARAIARHVQFFSIGTNDLIQYTMAADRGNESVAHLYQSTHPAILSLMLRTIDAAKAAGISVGVCGESAADPLLGLLWVAMGADHLSMSASYIPAISRLLSKLTRADLDDYRRLVESLDDGLSGADILAACQAWLTTHT